MSRNVPSDNRHAYSGPPAPAEGQVYIDNENSYWRVKRLTVAQSPAGFYLVHLAHGSSLDALTYSMVLGPMEFAALTRDRDLRPVSLNPA
jgi:hypothetical protein